MYERKSEGRERGSSSIPIKVRKRMFRICGRDRASIIVPVFSAANVPANTGIYFSDVLFIRRAARALEHKALCRDVAIQY